MIYVHRLLGRGVRPRYDGRVVQDSGGYSITEPEFASLLDDKASRTFILLDLRSWGIDLDPEDAESITRVHGLIQADPERQRAIYQIAMALWR